MLSSHPFARGVVDLVREVIARYGRLGGSQFAAAISYRALFSLVPLATFVATILAQVLSASNGNRQDVVSAITDQLDLTQQGAARLDSLIAAVPSPWSPAGLVALGLALWGATGVMSSVLKTLAVVFDEGTARGLVRGRLVSALLVLGALGLVLCAVIVSMLENVVGKLSANVDEALGWQPFGFGVVFGIVVPLGLAFLVFLLLYRYLPHNKPGWRAVLLGSAAAAIGFQAVQLGLGWYLSGPADFTKVYGSASAIFAFLFSVYLSASAFVICAILTAVLDERLPLRRS
jgi:membrane protein